MRSLPRSTGFLTRQSQHRIPLSKVTRRAVSTILNTKKHHDLSTFLSHASRESLSKKSTVYQGTLYEYTVLLALSRLGFNLSRVGGKDDAGIDLQGHWHLPFLTETIATGGNDKGLMEIDGIPAIIQCKSSAAKASPAVVRELEGSLKAAPGKFKQGIAILATPREATRGVRDAMMRAKVPLAFVKVPMLLDTDPDTVTEQSLANKIGGTMVEQFIWNNHASEAWLAGLGVTVKYDRDGASDGIRLSYRGRMVEPSFEGLQETAEAAEADLEEAAQAASMNRQ